MPVDSKCLESSEEKHIWHNRKLQQIAVQMQGYSQLFSNMIKTQRIEHPSTFF